LRSADRRNQRPTRASGDHPVSHSSMPATEGMAPANQGKAAWRPPIDMHKEAILKK
jgi:hypothetical protein